ncbi:MAG: tetratricopeptide repeat protein [Firmicutes bacterium]|nr:tetratricopeptide repeat protein [Bacillota bacterium]
METIDNNTDRNMSELIWEICLKTKVFLDHISEMGINLGGLNGDYEDLNTSFTPLLKEKFFIINLGEYNYRQGKYAKALEFYEALGDEAEREILHRMSELYSHTGSFEKASAIVDKLIELDESNPSVWLRKANIVIESETSLEDSVFYLEKALELDPDFIDALILMAKAWTERMESKKDAFIKNRMKKEAFLCLEKAEKQNEQEKHPAQEFNQACIYALKAKLEPGKKEEYRNYCIDLLAKIVESTDSEKQHFVERISQEKLFLEMDLFPIYGTQPAPATEQEPRQEQEQESAPEEQPQAETGEKQEESAQYFKEHEPRPSEIFGLSSSSLKDSGTGGLSPRDLIRDGKEQLRKRKESDSDNPQEKMHIMSPSDLFKE